jgi:hypothetical protein
MLTEEQHAWVARMSELLSVVRSRSTLHRGYRHRARSQPPIPTFDVWPHVPLPGHSVERPTYGAPAPR